jgi:hypothetical protein
MAQRMSRRKAHLARKKGVGEFLPERQGLARNHA